MIKFLLNTLYKFREEGKREIKDVKKILLFFVSPGIGDAVISSFFIRNLKILYPESEITLLSTPGGKILDGNANIDKFIWASNTEKKYLFLLAFRLLFLRGQKYDLLFDLPWNPLGYGAKRMLFLYMINAKNTFVANIEGYDFANFVMWNTENTSLIGLYKTVLKKLNFIGDINDDYEIKLCSGDLDFAKAFIDNNAIKKFILFNPEGSGFQKTVPRDKCLEILKKLSDKNITVVAINCDIAGIDKNNIFTFNGTIKQNAALIQLADYVITVDTSIMHIADAYNKNMTVLFAEENGFGNKNILKTHRPKNKNAIVLSGKFVEDISSDKIVNSVPCLLS